MNFKLKSFGTPKPTQNLGFVTQPPIIVEPKATRYLHFHNSAKPNNATAMLKFPPQYFSGSQLNSLYNVPVVTNTRNRQVKIAIVVAFSYGGLLNDLLTYWQNSINFGPGATPPKVSVYTMPGATFNDSWAQEECLDVQMVCAINPNANISVIEAKSDTLTDLFAAVDYATNTIKADVISMSWGMDDDPSLATYASRFSNPSVCYCAASGDSNIASWPSVLSNCVSVGGTTLLWTPTGSTPRTEFTWSGAGCGYSISVPQPTYQKNIANINHTYRVVPDVSLIGNDMTSVYTVYKGSWCGVGGTSVATPIFAAMVSLANQQRFNQSKGPLTSVFTNSPSNNIQNYMYNNIYTNNTIYSQCFNDILYGTDQGSAIGNANNLTNYCAGTKYDIPTGLGSPNCKNLCNQLFNI
jgi:subtilase family serine protease